MLLYAVHSKRVATETFSTLRGGGSLIFALRLSFSTFDNLYSYVLNQAYIVVAYTNACWEIDLSLWWNFVWNHIKNGVFVIPPCNPQKRAAGIVLTWIKQIIAINNYRDNNTVNIGQAMLIIIMVMTLE